MDQPITNAEIVEIRQFRRRQLPTVLVLALILTLYVIGGVIGVLGAGLTVAGCLVFGAIIARHAAPRPGRPDRQRA